MYLLVFDDLSHIDDLVVIVGLERGEVQVVVLQLVQVFLNLCLHVQQLLSLLLLC